MGLTLVTLSNPVLDFASQMQYLAIMKTATLPSIRVDPEFRATVESVLNETETLSEFVESAVRETVSRRRNQAEFLARGIWSLEAAKQANSARMPTTEDAVNGADPGVYAWDQRLETGGSQSGSKNECGRCKQLPWHARDAPDCNAAKAGRD